MKHYRALVDLTAKPPRCPRKPKPKVFYRAGDVVLLDTDTHLARWWLSQGFLEEIEEGVHEPLQGSSAQP